MTPPHRPHVVLVAAENGALAGAKVGGVADVILEVPRALATSAIDVTVLTPSHGFLHESNDAERLTTIDFDFAGRTHTATLYLATATAPGETSGGDGQIRQLIVDHPILATDEKGKLYLADPSDRPFARDSTRFACFCAACAAIINHGPGLERDVDVLHLHDWHTGYLAILRHSGLFPKLAGIRTVFTIHNLAFQGVRPIRDDESSFLAWFHDIEPNADIIGDPRWPWCVNPLAAAVRLCDAIHVVSPSYAQEIQRPDNVEAGPGTGGCGLEQLLIDANAQRRLSGILNGCHYHDKDDNKNADPRADSASRLNWATLRSMLRKAVDQQLVGDADGARARIDQVLSNIATTGPAPIVTSVGRIADQKTGLLLQNVDGDMLAIDALLHALGAQGLLIMLGSGDSEMESALGAVAMRHDNFLFLRGFSETLADALYRSGDLFLMPSTFEPCGISQMLAMRAGQPCLVHSVGGLKDTVRHRVNGFAFGADTRATQAKAMVDAADACFTRYRNGSYQDWQRLSQAARAARFEWSETIDQYISKLYAPSITRQKLSA